MTEAAVNGTDAGLAALREQGADQFDRPRWAYLEHLSTYLETATPRVAQRVQTRLQAALTDYESEWRATLSTVEDVTVAPPAVAASKVSDLTDLTVSLQSSKAEKSKAGATSLTAQLQHEDARLCEKFGGAASAESLTDQRELHAATVLRGTLARLEVDQRVKRALAEAPQESGPLNPQRLATASLASMRELSPRYLEHFLSYLDTLFWLQHQSKK